MTKYRNKPIVVDGERFHSQAEYSRWLLLSKWYRLGAIADLERQVRFVVAPSVKIVGKPRKSPEIRYYADFVYRKSDGSLVIEDVKGEATDSFRMKRHLLALQGIQITEIKA